MVHLLHQVLAVQVEVVLVVTMELHQLAQMEQQIVVQVAVAQEAVQVVLAVQA
jgi:hypothetical protein